MLKLFKRQDLTAISPSIVVFTVFFLLFLYFLYSVKEILILVFLAFLVMVALNPLVRQLQVRLRFPRVLAIAVVYVLVMGAVASLITYIAPQLVKQLSQLGRIFELPIFQQAFGQAEFSLTELSEVLGRVGSSAGAVFSVLSSTFAVVFTFFTVLVMSFYLMLDRKHLHLKVSWFTKNKQHLQMAETFLDSLEYQLGGWVRGQIILMLVIGVVTYVGLSLLGVQYALPLAILAGSLEILPNLGPTLASLPAIVLALVTQGPVMGGVVTLFYILVQQLENSILVPKIMKDNVDVSPLVSIVAILVGFKLGGVIGALLAIPVYIILRTVYSTWFRDLILQ